MKLVRIQPSRAARPTTPLYRDCCYARVLRRVGVKPSPGSRFTVTVCGYMLRWFDSNIFRQEN